MTKLSINVNKIATLRNSRGKNIPDVVKVSLDAIRFGAQGITVHPRPDGRHIRRQDVYDLKEAIDVELNIEGYPSADFLAMVAEVRPAQVTLVPDPPDAITSNAGWKVAENQALLKKAAQITHDAGARCSVFVEHSVPANDLALLWDFGVARVELYTEEYAEAFGTPMQNEVVAHYRGVADRALEAGLHLNAGHDLSLANLNTLIRVIPEIQEVSIGHALIADALYLGLEQTIQKYLACLESE